MEPEEETGRDRDAGAARPGEQRECLAQADHRRVTEGQRLEVARSAAPSLGEPEQPGPGEDEDPDPGDSVAERAVEEALERRAQDRRRDDRHEEQPGEPSLGVAGQAPVADRREPRPEEADEVAPEVDEEGDERPEVEHDVERGRVDEGIVPAEEARHEDEMGRGRDREELGQSLDESEDRGMDQAVHGGSVAFADPGPIFSG